VSQGRYFYTGWGQAQPLAIGYDAQWQQKLNQPGHIEELKGGKVFASEAALDRHVAGLLTGLGDRALERDEPAALLEAVHYYKRAQRLLAKAGTPPPEERAIRQQLVGTLLRLSDSHLARANWVQARDALHQAAIYEPQSAEIAQRQVRLQASNSGAGGPDGLPATAAQAAATGREIKSP
jgi:hypothetical protein